MRGLLAMSIGVLTAVLMAVTAPASAAAERRQAQAELSMEDEVAFHPQTGATQVIRFSSGDDTQTVTIDVTGKNPTGRSRAGGSCGSGSQFDCTGTGPVTLTYAPYPGISTSQHLHIYSTVTATAEDGATASGIVRVTLQADMRISQVKFRNPGTDDTTTVFSANIDSDGPDAAVLPAVQVAGLDTSLGLPEGCGMDKGAVLCFVEGSLPQTVSFTIPACSALKPVTAQAASANEDPDKGNNKAVAAPLDPKSSGMLKCAGPGGSTGGSGSGGGTGSGGSGSGQKATPTPKPTPTPTHTVVPSPSSIVNVTDAPTQATAAAAAAKSNDDSGPSWGLVAGGVGGAVAVFAAGLGGWWWRRRARQSISGDTYPS